MVQGSPDYVTEVASKARRAVNAAILAENTACYFDGDLDTRRQALEAKERALDLINELERLAKQ
jgi:hypothetical protein